MSTLATERSGSSSMAEHLHQQIGQHFKSILTGVITSILATWVLSFMTNWALLQKLVVVPEVALLLLTPFLLRAGFAHLNITVGRFALIILSTLFILGEAMIFSTLAGGRLPTLPATAIRHSDIFSGEYLLGSSGCLEEAEPCYNQLRVTNDDVRVVEKPTGDLDELHIQLGFQWDKREKTPTLPRNYRGTFYYKIEYKCGNAVESSRIEPPTLIGYSLRPGQIALSWLIGFVEIPFVLDGEQTVPKNVQKIAIENELLCSSQS